MSDFKHEESEQLSPQQVAERLTDLAYALATGGALKLGDDEQITSQLPIMCCWSA
jgi:hypothetical protein